MKIFVKTGFRVDENGQLLRRQYSKTLCVTPKLGEGRRPLSRSLDIDDVWFLQGPSKGFVHLEGHPSFDGSPKKRMKLSQIWVATQGCREKPP